MNLLAIVTIFALSLPVLLLPLKSGTEELALKKGGGDIEISLHLELARLV